MSIPITWFVASLFLGWAGRHRAIGFWGVFLISLVISPIVMAFVLLASYSIFPPRKKARAS